jgi:hypothetical protein
MPNLVLSMAEVNELLQFIETASKDDSYAKRAARE